MAAREPGRAVPGRGATRRWVCVLGAGRSQLPALEALQRRGVSTLVFDRDERAPGAPLATRFLPLGLDRGEEIEAACVAHAARHALEGCVVHTSFAPAQATAARLRQRLGWLGPRPATWRALCDKTEAKTRLAAAGVPTAAGEALRTELALDRFLARHPRAVVKPAREGCGAAGVAEVRAGAPGRTAALRRACAASGDGMALVEAWVGAREWSVDGVVAGGRARVLAVSRKHVALRGRAPRVLGLSTAFPVRGAARWEVLAQGVAGALDLDQAPFSLDVREDAAGRLVVIDVGPLFDAKIDRLLLHAGVDVWALEADLALGATPAVPEPRPGGYAACFVYAARAGRLRAPTAPAEPGAHVEWERGPGAPVRPPASVADLVATVLVRGEDRERAWHTAVRAASAPLFRVEDAA